MKFLKLFSKPELPPIDVVNSWFSELPVDYNNGRVTDHLTFLQNNGNKPVKHWSTLFANCMEDIGRNYTDINKYNSVKEKFLNQSGYKNQEEALNENQEKALNDMTKKDFVLLFTKIMTPIIENEQREQEKLEQKQREQKQREQEQREQEKREQAIEEQKQRERNENGCTDEEVYVSYNNINRCVKFNDRLGGSNKKSYKYATRKYKKINKR